MRLALVEYRGARIAPFQVQVRDHKDRLWAHGQQGDIIKQRRWLPEDEARAYEKFPDFAIIKWGSDDGVSVQAPQRHPNWRAPKAQHVTDFINDEPEQIPAPAPAPGPESVAQQPEQEIAPEYVMSKTGVVHLPACQYAKRASGLTGFQTLEEAAVHPDFQKYCQCIVGD